MDGARHAQALLHLRNLAGGVAQSKSRTQIERNRNRGKKTCMVYLQRSRAYGGLHQAGERSDVVDARLVGIGGGREIDAVQTGRILPVLGSDFKHDVILVELGVDDGDLRLAEGAVECAVERLRGLAQPRSRGAIERELRLQPAVLLVTVHVLQP